jgi:ribosomal protein L37AE/L43A
MPKTNTKPHIYLSSFVVEGTKEGIWACSRKGALSKGWGLTPQKAYDEWLKLSQQIYK